MSEPPSEPRHDDVRPVHEELPSRLILRTMLATVMVGASLCFATYLIMRGRMLSLRPSYQFPEQSLPPPREVAEVRQELFHVANPRPTVKDSQRAALDQFGWVDRGRRVVHVPIEDAIDLVVKRASQSGGRP